MVIGQYNNAACILHYISQGKHNWKRYAIFTITKAVSDKNNLRLEKHPLKQNRGGRADYLAELFSQVGVVV